MPKLLVIAVHSLPKIRSINFKHTNGLKWTKMRKCYKIVLRNGYLTYVPRFLRAPFYDREYSDFLFAKIAKFIWLGYRWATGLARQQGQVGFRELNQLFMHWVQNIFPQQTRIQVGWSSNGSRHIRQVFCISMLLNKLFSTSSFSFKIRYIIE